MSIKMTNLQLMNIIQLLNKFPNVTGKLGRAISITKSHMLDALKPFEVEREKLIQEYGTEDEDGTVSVKENQENFEEYAKKIDSIAEKEVDIEIEKVSLADYYAVYIYNSECSARDYDFLQFLFVDRTIVGENVEEK